MNEETLKRFQEVYDKKFSHSDEVGKTAYWSKLAMDGRFHLDTPIPESENSLRLILYENLSEC